MTVKNDKLTKYVGKTFEELLKDKMERKGMTAEEAINDIMNTASTTNADVNESFELEIKKNV